MTRLGDGAYVGGKTIIGLGKYMIEGQPREKTWNKLEATSRIVTLMFLSGADQRYAELRKRNQPKGVQWYRENLNCFTANHPGYDKRPTHSSSVEKT